MPLDCERKEFLNLQVDRFVLCDVGRTTRASIWWAHARLNETNKERVLFFAGGLDFFEAVESGRRTFWI